jgi:taurine--2-oxoglutarate transaminase
MNVNQSQFDAIAEQNKKYTYFSWCAQENFNTIPIKKAKGVYLWDYNDKRYLDFSSQLVLTNIGHCDPRVTSAMKEQLDLLPYVQPSFSTKVRGELGQLLSEVTPGDLQKTFFTLGGAEGIEHAMKMARLVTGKQKILARYRAYHGGTVAAGSVGGDPRRFGTEPGVGWVVRIHDPYPYRSPLYQNLTPELGDQLLIDLIEETIKLEGPDSIAGILLEGYSGSSGVIAPSSPAYFKSIRKLCDRYNILLICDEVMSGFGRTGKWFGIDHAEVVPDIMVCAKGLTSGYAPLGAVITNEKVARYFDKNVLSSGLTYSAHALSCAAALATIKIYQTDQLVEKANLDGVYLKEIFKDFLKKHISVGEVRGTGLHWCLELVKNKETKEELSGWNQPPSKYINELNLYLKKKGLLTLIRWNHLYICPPLSITRDELNSGLEIIDEALKDLDQSLS